MSKNLQLVRTAIHAMGKEQLMVALEAAALQGISKYLKEHPMPKDWTRETAQFVMSEMLAVCLVDAITEAAQVLMVAAESEEKAPDPQDEERAKAICESAMLKAAGKLQ